MRYAPKQWRAVAILMRDSSYAILEALTETPKTWTELKLSAKLTDGGLQKVLRELIKMNIVEETLVDSEGFKKKKYALKRTARKEKIYEKAKDLKASLEKLALT